MSAHPDSKLQQALDALEGVVASARWVRMTHDFLELYYQDGQEVSREQLSEDFASWVHLDHEVLATSFEKLMYLPHELRSLYAKNLEEHLARGAFLANQ